MGNLSLRIEQLHSAADVSFGLLHGRNIQKYKGLPEIIIGVKTTN